MTPDATATARAPALSVPEFVTLMAALMALNALAIDIMLPALPNMGQEFGVDDPNHRQFVVVGYVLGLGAAQLFFGPLSDRYGRRRPLLFSLWGYSIFGLACIFAPSFEMLVVARTLQGVAAAGARVISLSVVRDSYAGRGMARIMSLIMMVFMAVPILAPGLGQLVLLVAPWQWIFVVLVVFGLGVSGWVAWRLTETLPEEERRPISLPSLWEAYGLVFKNRVSAGYMAAGGVIFGALFAYISTAEQLFSDVFDRKESFGLYFAGIAGGMAIGAFLNSRFVVRFGMRRLSHGAVVAFTGINVVHVGLLLLGADGFGVFYSCMVACFFCFSLVGANFNSLAMEPLGEVAGTASAVLGFASTILAGGLGGWVGQRFDGTTMPIALGFLVLGLATLGIVLLTERGRLFARPPVEARVSHPPA